MDYCSLKERWLICAMSLNICFDSVNWTLSLPSKCRSIQWSELWYNFLLLCTRQNTHGAVLNKCSVSHVKCWCCVCFIMDWNEPGESCAECDRGLQRVFCCCFELNASVFSHRCELWCVFKRELQRAPIQVFNLLRLRPLCILLRKWSHDN